MKTITLTKGFVALVDDEDYEWLSQWKWQYGEHGPRAFRHDRSTHNTNLSMHRVIMNAPVGIELDHINRIGLDNRRSNLRLATRRQNSANQSKKKNATASKYKGVGLHQGKYWYASVRISGKRIHLGHFPTELEAAHAYDDAARKE